MGGLEVTGPVGIEGVGCMSDCAADVAGGRGGGRVVVAGCPDITPWFVTSCAKGVGCTEAGFWREKTQISGSRCTFLGDSNRSSR